MHRSYAVRYVKYELMVCHKTLWISLTKEYDNIYTATKKKKKKKQRGEQIMNNQSTSKQNSKHKEIERTYHF